MAGRAGGACLDRAVRPGIDDAGRYAGVECRCGASRGVPSGASAHQAGSRAAVLIEGRTRRAERITGAAPDRVTPLGLDGARQARRSTNTEPRDEPPLGARSDDTAHHAAPCVSAFIERRTRQTQRSTDTHPNQTSPRALDGAEQARRSTGAERRDDTSRSARPGGPTHHTDPRDPVFIEDNPLRANRTTEADSDHASSRALGGGAPPRCFAGAEGLGGASPGVRSGA